MDLHRHDQFSAFDGFGKADDLAALAKSYGYTALGTANHGTVSGLVQHYQGCKKHGLKPILGVEAYFQLKIDPDNRSRSRYHLCLFAKDVKGYTNLNHLMSIAEKQKYYKPIITFANLKKYSEGIICTSACIGGPVTSFLRYNNPAMAVKVANKFVEIFGDDFYIELQPYKIDDEHTQEKANLKLIKLAEKLDIPMILTSDSHYGAEDDFETYLRMHQIGGTKYDVRSTYGERYMPALGELNERFETIYSDRIPKAKMKRLLNEFEANLDEIESKVDPDILDKLELKLPEFVEGQSSFDVLLEQVKEGLKIRKVPKHKIKAYTARAKEELRIIKMHGFEDYFLIVSDYVRFAKSKGIAVGPGRGSVCNCEVAYLLQITEVDSIQFNLDFRRFLREDKKKLPDIDLDFETSRRQEVIDYILDKYPGHAAQISSYGNYMVDNLLNDLAKLSTNLDAAELKRLKSFVRSQLTESVLDYKAMAKTQEARYFNKAYDNILLHFSKMYKKVRYMGVHAGGVAVTGGQIEDYCAVRITKEGKRTAVYNLADLETVNVTKFDVLGLSTMEQISELRKLTGDVYDPSWLEDPVIFENFGQGNTDGIFQFESRTAKQILVDIQCDCFEDAVAASSMNRPGPLALGMPQQYAENKMSGPPEDKLLKYTQETYGAVVYQEQLQQICIELGNMSWPDADRVMKCLKNVGVEAVRLQVEKDKKELTKLFVAGAVENGIDKKEAQDLFSKVLVYSFNKGHGVGYTIISVEEMHYKIYHPTKFWITKLKFSKPQDRYKYLANATFSGALIFIPHVNYAVYDSSRKVEGEEVIQEGLVSVKGVGEKAAQYIYNERMANGNYKSFEDFIGRCKVKGSPVNKGIIEKLLDVGALEFNKKVYIKRVTKYNSTLYANNLR